MSVIRVQSRLGMALALVAAAILPFAVGSNDPVLSSPVASDGPTYQLCGRVFADPQAFGPSPVAQPGESPFAEGNRSCRASYFIQYPEAIEGLSFLETIDPADYSGMYPDGGRPFSEFLEVQHLAEDFPDVLNLEDGDGFSSGLPTTAGQRERRPLTMFKVTDEKSPIPEADREHFVFSLSIHGIERAGAEGGIRAIEDFVTWGATDPDRPLSVTDPRRSVTVGEALERSVVYFTLVNPDGWSRGNLSEGRPSFQRYNGNGIDMNRDWPARGWTFEPFTPLSEPETRSFAKVLLSIKDKTSQGRFTGGNDLHGQLIDGAFSFTLIGGAKRNYAKDQVAAQVMQRIWADQETRLSWSSLIKSNTESADDPRLYADQWGTIWDTIDYTVTGAYGDWIDAPVGLDALGLDNEMSLSHLSNCGTGTCFVQEFEQLHVDGNKGLIYAQINLQLKNLQQTLRLPGRNAYIDNPYRVSEEARSGPGTETEPLPPQDDLAGSIIPPGSETYEFIVLGPDDGVFNGGLTANMTFTNAQGESPSSLTAVIVERRRAEEEALSGEWEEVNSDFNQSFLYRQAGMTVNVNGPRPGEYRVRLEGAQPGVHNVEINFTTQQAWPDPGQVAYDVQNTDFFVETNAWTLPEHGFEPVSPQALVDGTVDLSVYDSLVVPNDFLPGWREAFVAPEPGNGPQPPIEGTALTGPPSGGATRANDTYFEFDVLPGFSNDLLEVVARPTAPADLDMHLQMQAEDGSWSDDLSSGTSFSVSVESLSYAGPLPGRYRVAIDNFAGPAGSPIAMEVTFTADTTGGGDTEPAEPIVYTDVQRDAVIARLADFARGGGNLLLTDAAFDLLNRINDAADAAPLLGPGAAREILVYAGNIQFNDGGIDGGDGVTYARYDLAKEVNRPGSAEGAGNRHQIAEPIPTGHAVTNLGGGDINSHPSWVVDPDLWLAAGGTVVGRTNAAAGGVSFGELPYGDGVIRIIGGILPEPTKEFTHNFGLEAYSLTYSGFQVLDNALQWTRPGSTWRLGGASRYETAVEVAEHNWNTIETVVIASGQSFPDALVAAPLAAALDAPILLARKDGLEGEAFDYLLRRKPQPVKAYIIGGEAVMGAEVVDDLERLLIPASGIVRLGGADRFETSVLVANELESVLGTAATAAVVATGRVPGNPDSWPDALAAAPIAGRFGQDGNPAPLLLVQRDEVPASVSAWFDGRTIATTLVAGGESAVGAATASSLPNVRRVAGRDRYETSALLASEMESITGFDVTEVTVATGTKFPDALVVAPAGARERVPTLLVRPSGIAGSPAESWLRARATNLMRVYVAGSTGVLPASLDAEIEAIIATG